MKLKLRHDTSPKAAARRQVFRKRIPRNKWLCANDDRFKEHSLSFYFGRTPCRKVWELVKAMGREKTIRFANEQMFRADASQSYGANLRWIAFGVQPPTCCVADQLRIGPKYRDAPSNATVPTPPAATTPISKSTHSRRRSPRVQKQLSPVHTGKDSDDRKCSDHQKLSTVIAPTAKSTPKRRKSGF